MVREKFTIEAQEDFLERLTRARPLNAIAELIWNGLDADATRVDVVLDSSRLGLTAISVRDNGHGIPHEDARELFRRLGGSWKALGGTTRGRGRALHGYEGRGRLKALALGRVADWTIAYEASSGERRSYKVSVIADAVKEGRISDERPTDVAETGVEVRITEPVRDFRSLRQDSALQELTETFALYLKDYRDVVIHYDGVRIDPSAAIASSQEFRLRDIEHEGESFSASLELVEWISSTQRTLYLCNESGFPLTQVPSRFHVGDFQFSAYLKSSLITKLAGESMLEIAELTPSLAGAIDESKKKIKDYAGKRTAEKARLVVQEWKDERIYPYEGEAVSSIEEAERKVFEIVAVTASGYMQDFEDSPRKNKAFQLRMLRAAIERSPNDLQMILTEVLDLPRRKQKELAALLREASLSAIIGAAKTVADRLSFLSALEVILFETEKKKKLKERSQLHRILADNTWIFGEEFHLSVDDKSLTEVLRKHYEAAGDEIVIDRPVRHVSKTRGIVDLMLSRAIRQHRATGIEHLVVELKRPSVVIGSKELVQIEEYALSVANDERFRGVDASWNFWVISDDYDQNYVAHRIKSPDGLIDSKDNIKIGVKTWGQLLEENKARMQFFQERLEHQVDQGRALASLQKKYGEFLEGVVSPGDIQQVENEDGEVDEDFSQEGVN